MSLAVLLFGPMLTIAVSRMISKKKVVFSRTLVQEWLYDLLICLSATCIICIPPARMAVIALYPGILLIRFGRTAMLVYGVLCILFGLVLGGLKASFETGALPAVSRKKRSPALNALWHTSVLILLVLTFGCFWGATQYGAISFQEILFYLFMPLKGTSTTFVSGLILFVIIPAAISFAAYILLSHYPFKRHAFSGFTHLPLLRMQWLPFRPSAFMGPLLLLSWFLCIFCAADQYLFITDYVSSQINHSMLIEQEYADPAAVALTFPEEKRNLIHIFIESAETTNQDKANGGAFDVNYTPELTQLAHDHVSFSQSELLQGAAIAPACGWTIAGMVAQSSGLPLKMGIYDDRGADNIGGLFATFLPGATTLGDILLEAGYKNVIMAGSDFTFGGRKQYYVEHGSYEIWDLLTARQLEKIPEDYMRGWGFEDQKLYAFAKENLTELSQSGQPFNLTLLTVDTHEPGYTCPSCPVTGEIPYARALRCSSALAAEFVAWCQQQPFYENTTIVITGDHASMIADFYSEIPYEKHRGDTTRLAYNAFINAAAEPVQEKNRLFTTLDFFPTTLAAMGVSIEGERLALGVNLFSDAPTLCEIYGYEELFAELNKRSNFYDEHILFP